MDIYLDFDGTVVEHSYPGIGEYNLGATEVIKKLKKAGHTLILNTARVEFENGTFELAIDYLNQIMRETLFSIQNSTKSKISPCKWDWELFSDRQAIYIDDISEGIPLRLNVKLSEGNMVDWEIIDLQFKENNIY